MKLEELFDYKNRLMKEFCCDEDIVRLITDKNDNKVPNHALAYSQIFPYEFIPETVDNGQTFICFDVDIAEVINKTFYAPVLYIWIFTHKSKIRLPEGGVRTDLLASKIDSLLNGSRFYGLGELDLKQVGRFSPITDYQGRMLVYLAKDFNRCAINENNSKSIPSNRKNVRR